MLFHDVRYLAQRIGPGNVSGSFIKSGPGICQENISFLQLYIGLRRGGVVAERRMFSIGRDRLEAWTDKSAHLSTELIQLVGCAHLCDLHLAHVFL